ncbi:MAG: M1 family metallopeptidase [Chloroflexi bacterium]|nr:M1 family metallopeptidase [Chloroflexota bacterium]
MKSLRLIFLLAILLTACAPVPSAPTALPTAPGAPDELAIYRQSLLPAHQRDLDQLDRPTRYDLTLQFDAATPTLAGNQSVRYVNRQTTPLNEIYFRTFANYPESGGKIIFTRVALDGALAPSSFEVESTALRIPLTQPLAPGAITTIQLDWTITIPRDSKAHYADFGASDSITTLPTILPLIPAYDAHGWHIELPPAYGDLVYADMSLFAVTLTVPSKLNVIASGTTIETRDNRDGTATHRIVGAPMRDFDLNITEKMQKASATVGAVTINSWFDPNDADAGKKALQFATDAFKIFQTRIGAYPYRELDVIETPTTAGGIEYPGVIVIGRNLYRSERERQFFEFATAHEVAHQWWYALVGNDQVNAPWQDEALTQYTTLIYYEDTQGAQAGQTILKQVFQDVYDRAKKAGRDAIVGQPVRAFDERAYGEIVYGKGPLFFDALRKKMGDDAFYKFLRTYFERYRYKIATPEDLIKTAEEVAGQSLRAEYQDWILSAGK